jgi:hypothetical protein
MSFEEVLNGVKYKYVYDIIGSPKYQKVSGRFREVAVRFMSEKKDLFIIELAIVEVTALVVAESEMVLNHGPIHKKHHPKYHPSLAEVRQQRHGS